MEHKPGYITVVGSAALDTIETSKDRVENCLGGSVSFVGAVGGLFAPIHVIAIVGDDFPMQEYDFLKERGVNLDGLEIAEGKTFHWEGRYHEDMNQRDTIATELGVFEGFKPKLTREASKAEYLLLANINPELQLNVMTQIKKPQFVVYDTMNLWINTNLDGVTKMLGKVDMVTVNDEEVYLLTQETSLLKGARKLLELGPKYVVVKKGEHGSILVGRDGSPFLCPAYPITDPVDPTGAGDTFAGAMLGYLASTSDLGPFNVRRAVVYGTVAASFTVEAFGVERLKTLTHEELNSRYRTFQEMIEF